MWRAIPPGLYTCANLLHVLGAALLVGAIATFDAALVLRRDDSAAIVGRIAIPIAAFGVALQIPTGVVLLAPEARALGVNPAFFFKMTFLAVGLSTWRSSTRGSAARCAPACSTPAHGRSRRLSPGRLDPRAAGRADDRLPMIPAAARPGAAGGLHGAARAR